MGHHNKLARMRKGDGKNRTCLKCNKGFVSSGPGNRICNNCYSDYNNASMRDLNQKKCIKN